MAASERRRVVGVGEQGRPAGGLGHGADVGGDDRAARKPWPRGSGSPKVSLSEG